MSNKKDTPETLLQKWDSQRPSAELSELLISSNQSSSALILRWWQTYLGFCIITPPGCCNESWHCSSSPRKVSSTCPFFKSYPPPPPQTIKWYRQGQRNIWSLHLGSKRSSVLMILNVNRDEKAWVSFESRASKANRKHNGAQTKFSLVFSAARWLAAIS